MRKAVLLAGCGVGLGAGLMYVLDPDRGRRRRALLRDKALHYAGEARITLGKRGRDIGNRARGLLAGAGSHLRCGEEVSDGVLAERVRSKMGRAVSEPGDVEVAVSEGRVTLRGIVPAGEAERLLRCVSKARGVLAVENQLKLKGRRGEAARAGHSGGGVNGEHSTEHTISITSLLATVAGSGLALYGARRRGVLGSAVSLVGLRMLGRAVNDAGAGKEYPSHRPGAPATRKEDSVS